MHLRVREGEVPLKSSYFSKLADEVGIHLGREKRDRERVGSSHRARVRLRYPGESTGN